MALVKTISTATRSWQVQDRCQTTYGNPRENSHLKWLNKSRLKRKKHGDFTGLVGICYGPSWQTSDLVNLGGGRVSGTIESGNVRCPRNSDSRLTGSAKRHLQTILPPLWKISPYRFPRLDAFMLGTTCGAFFAAIHWLYNALFKLYIHIYIYIS